MSASEGGAVTCMGQVIRSYACFITIALLLRRELHRVCNNALVISWIFVADGKKPPNPVETEEENRPF